MSLVAYLFVALSCGFCAGKVFSIKGGFLPSFKAKINLVLAWKCKSYVEMISYNISGMKSWKDDVFPQIVNQFLFLSAGTAALTKLKEMLRKPEEIPSFLADSLPARATFFICYIMLRSFTGFSLELLRVVDLIVIPIKRKWFCYTPREDEAAWRPPYVMYDRVVSIHRFAELSFRLYLQGS